MESNGNSERFSTKSKNNLTPKKLYEIIYNKKYEGNEKEIEMIQTYISQFKESNNIEVGQFQKLLKDLYNFMGDFLMPLIPKENLVKIPKEKYIFIKKIHELIK